jgi:prefoldin subunit 5
VVGRVVPGDPTPQSLTEDLAKRVEALEAQRDQDQAKIRSLEQAIEQLRSDVPVIIAQQNATRNR